MINRVDIFNLVGYFGLACKEAGLLYPIFRSGSSNNPFVQDVNRFGVVESFIPFHELDECKFYPTKIERKMWIGCQSIYAFFEKNYLREIDFEEVHSLVRESSFENRDDIDELARLNLGRVGDLSITQQSDMLHRYLLGRNLSKSSIEVSKTAERILILERPKIWSEIELVEYKHEYKDNPFNSWDTEDLFEFLFENNFSDVWDSALTSLLRRKFYDDRLADLLDNYFSSTDDDIENFSDIQKKFLARRMEMFNHRDGEGDDFFELLVEYIIDGRIFLIDQFLPISELCRFIELACGKSTVEILSIDVFLDKLNDISNSKIYIIELFGRILNSSNIFDLYQIRADDNDLRDADYSRADVFADFLKNSPRVGSLFDQSERRRFRKILEQRQM